MGKLCILSLSFTLYLNLVFNLSIVSIWSLNFQCHVNLAPSIISWTEITDMANSQNKKLVYCHIDVVKV